MEVLPNEKNFFFGGVVSPPLRVVADDEVLWRDAVSVVMEAESLGEGWVEVFVFEDILVVV